jgi:hypothetical protein
MKISFLIILFIFVFYSQVSFAYIGPGIAVGTIVIIFGIFGVLLLAILAVLYYPIKKMIKKIKLKKLKNK